MNMVRPSNLNLMSWVAAALFYWLGVASSFALEEGIVIDPNTGDYVINYFGYDEAGDRIILRQVTYVPSNKIDPIVKSKFRKNENENENAIAYRYKFTNGVSSRQALIGGRLTASNVDSTSQAIPVNWMGSVTQDQRVGNIVGWSFRMADDASAPGLNPGHSQNGFGFESTDLPGVGAIEFWGDQPIQGFPDEGPDPETEVGKQFLQLQEKDFIVRYAAVPRISIPTPFDAATVLVSLNKHLKEDLVAMKLVDPVFAGQLGGLLDSAVAAVRRGDTETAHGFIKDIHYRLKKEHGDLEEEEDWDKENTGEPEKRKAAPLIDKLAARVLDFDLKYIDKRLKKRGI